MKFQALILCITIVSSSLAADTLSSNINQATIFLSGAQVFRETNKFQVSKGVQEVIIPDVSSSLNPNDIQASANGNFLILDVKFVREAVVPNKSKPNELPESVQREMKEIGDSLLFIGFEMDVVDARIETLNKEKEMLMTNKLMKGGGKSDSLPVLKDALTYYREKLGEINELLQDWRKKKYFVEVRRQGFTQRLNELKSFRNKIPNKPVGEDRYHILITTYSETSTYGSIEANYLVPNAGWIPSYDLRANNITDPMNVTYKARVFQNSGEDWSNVKLVLSTFNQNCFTTKPELGVWRLDYRDNRLISQGSQDKRFSQNFRTQQEMETFINSGYASMNSGNIVVDNKSFTSPGQISDISESFSNVEFEVKMPYSIPADGSQKLMVIDQKEVEADFYHYLLPRANKHGFLLAKVGNWEELNLLPGAANIYFEKTYVGKTSIDPASILDSLEVSLGRNQGIVSDRKKLSDETSKKSLGTRRKRTLEFQIVVKNNTGAAVELSLEDQIPIAKNEDIEIDLVDAPKADYSENTGMMTWSLSLDPGESKEVRFTYSVEYDKDKPLL